MRHYAAILDGQLVDVNASFVGDGRLLGECTAGCGCTSRISDRPYPIATAPEPAAVGMVAAALAGLGGEFAARRRRRR